jgi:hypothetical protein
VNDVLIVQPASITSIIRFQETTTMSEPKYPNVQVQLTNHDGNAYAVLARCRDAARKAGVGASEIAAFTEEATSGDYDRLLQVCLKWFDVS